MKKYPKYKPSNIDWIGDIPEHWDVKRLKYVATASPSNIDKKSKENEDTIFLCNYVDVYKNDFITDEIEFMKATASKAQIEKFTLKKGDIIATKDSESANDIGIAALVKQDFEDVVCGYHLTYIKPEKLLGEYLFRQFQSEYIKRKFETLANGVTRYALGVDAFNCLNLVLPPEEEQIAIANYLDKKTQEIDQLIEDKKQLIQLFEEEKKVVISLAVSKGISQNVAVKESGIDWMGLIPKHWDIKKLNWCFSNIGSGTTPKSGEEEYYFNGYINWLLTGDLNDGEIIETTKKITDKAIKDYSSLKIYPVDSIVIAMYGATIGKLGLLKIETTVNQACCVMSNPLHHTTMFLFYYLLAVRQEIINMSYGGGQPNISQEILKTLKITVPPLDEQEKIVNHIELESRRIDSKIEKTKKLIDLLIEYRSALISEVVIGKVKVID